MGRIGFLSALRLRNVMNWEKTPHGSSRQPENSGSLRFLYWATHGREVPAQQRLPAFRFHFFIADGLLLNLNGPVSPQANTSWPDPTGCLWHPSCQAALIRRSHWAAKEPSAVFLAPSVWTFGVHGVLPYQGIKGGGCGVEYCTERRNKG